MQANEGPLLVYKMGPILREYALQKTLHLNIERCLCIFHVRRSRKSIGGILCRIWVLGLVIVAKDADVGEKRRLMVGWTELGTWVISSGSIGWC
jgi:hypothetical protein